MIENIAKHLGISKTTVSRALSGNGRVSKKTRQRVLQYTAEIGYIPNAAASNLATTKTKNIAFSMPLNRDSTRSGYFLECMFGVSKAAMEKAYDVFIVGDDLESITRIINSRKADGVVLSRNKFGDEALAKLTPSGIPIVITGTSNVPEIVQISYDARAAFREFTLRLIDMWQGPFGLIVTRRIYPANVTRAQGFTDALTIRDLSPASIAWDADTDEEVFQAYKDMSDKGIRNIVCGDEAVCLPLLGFTKGSKERINIASFHSNFYLRQYHPDVPVVELDPEKLGRIACKLLLQKIEGQEVPALTLLDYALKFS